MRYISILLLCALLLVGCETNSLRHLPPETEAAAAPARQGLYVPESAIERKTDGTVQAFPLPVEDAYGVLMQGEDVLVFSGVDDTTLTRLTGDDLCIANQVTFSRYLSVADVTVTSETLRYYEADTRQMVVLDTAFQELCRYTLPKDVTGKPILSSDRNTLYYCTANAVKAWELRKNLHRTLKMISYPQQELQGLFWNDRVLQCRIADENQEITLFLSVETGQILHRQEGSITFADGDGFYCASFPTGMYQTLVFGAEKEKPSVLTPRELSPSCTFLLQCHGAIALWEDSGQAQLQYYDLNTGHLTASLSLPHAPDSMVSGTAPEPYLLVFDAEFGCPTLYRWDCSGEAGDDTLYISPYHTREDPDTVGLELCRAYAAQLSETYGVQIRIGEDAAAVAPWDYKLEPEFSVPVLQRELEALEQRLSQYPPSLLADTASQFSSLSICLVRHLTGRAQSGSLDTAIGIQFTQGEDAYLVLAVGRFSQHGLYHEFFHLMEPYILSNSTAFDGWEQLNPVGFSYDYSYTANALRDSSEVLHREDRAFVDTYSMSFPKEDRARILEYAMLPGNEELFQSPTLQRKLQTLCKGIREAYRLADSVKPTWEQYQATPGGNGVTSGGQ